MYSLKMAPHRDMSTEVHEMVTAISITVCAIMNSVRVVMNSSFGSTAVRSGRDFACLMKNLAYLTMSFITEFIWATTAHLPYDTKRQRRLDRTGWLRTAYRLLPRSHGNNEYDKQSFPCCQPYNGCGEDAWATFVGRLSASMATTFVAGEPLKETLKGRDTAGDKWLAERHPGSSNNRGTWYQGSLIRPNGASALQRSEHRKRVVQ